MGPIGLIGSTGSIGTRAHGSTSGRRWDVRFRELQAEAWPPRTGLGPRKESAAGLGPENGGFTYTDTQTLRPPEKIEKNRHFRGKMKRWLIDGIGFRACPIFREPTQISFRWERTIAAGAHLGLDLNHLGYHWIAGTCENGEEGMTLRQQTTVEHICQYALKRTPGLALSIRVRVSSWYVSVLGYVSHQLSATINLPGAFLVGTEVSMAHKRGEEGKNCSQFFFTSKALLRHAVSSDPIAAWWLLIHVDPLKSTLPPWYPWKFARLIIQVLAPEYRSSIFNSHLK